MTMLPDWLRFASEAMLAALWGGLFLSAAGIAFVMDRARQRRDRVGRPDSVGWVPWTGVFLTCAVLGAGLLAVSVPVLLRN